MNSSALWVLLLLPMAFAHSASMGMQVIDAPAEPAAIVLNTGGVAGAGAPESWFLFNDQATVRNVQRATLTPFLPDKRTATGATVIIAPGGGFLFLSMENEGWPVARWLADRGIAAFVLKYRLTPSPISLHDFEVEAERLFADEERSHVTIAQTTPQSIADAQAALQLVRARAAEWNIDPKRIGLMGFSAGAMMTLAVTLRASPSDMPAFIAPIYGPMDAVTVPPDGPPMFVALAADDPLFAKWGFGLVESWKSAGKPVEFHLFKDGSHGFGMGRANTATKDWMEKFRLWMEASGFGGR